jgi:hypothetical protein
METEIKIFLVGKYYCITREEHIPEYLKLEKQCNVKQVSRYGAESCYITKGDEIN